MSETPPQVTSQKVFCSRCVASTSDETPGDVSTLNGIGRKFYGSAHPCPECGSVIRTLWWTFIDCPLVPLGSYRYKTAKDLGIRAQFWCRKLPAMDQIQVLKTWVTGLVIAAALITGYAIYESHKH